MSPPIRPVLSSSAGATSFISLTTLVRCLGWQRATRATTTLLASLLYILLKLRGSLEGGISGGKDSAGASGVTQRAAYANVAGAAARQDRPTIDSEGGRPSSPTPYDAASQARAARRAQGVLF